MSKKILAFILALMSFIGFIPAYAVSTGNLGADVGQMINYFSGLGKVVNIQGPTAVVGEINGNYEAFKEIDRKLRAGLASGEIQNVVFLGNIVYPGQHNSEVLRGIFNLWDDYKDRNCIYILKGGNESHTAAMNFSAQYPEVQSECYIHLLMTFYDSLPYAAIINGSTFASCGGIPIKGSRHCFFGEASKSTGFNVDILEQACRGTYGTGLYRTDIPSPQEIGEFFDIVYDYSRSIRPRHAIFGCSDTTELRIRDSFCQCSDPTTGLSVTYVSSCFETLTNRDSVSIAVVPTDGNAPYNWFTSKRVMVPVPVPAPPESRSGLSRIWHWFTDWMGGKQ